MAYMTEFGKLQMEAEALRLQVFELQRRLRAATKKPCPPAPDNGSWLTVMVKFFASPHWYRFLIMHVPGKGYYTTGQADNGFFPTWEKLWEYLDGPEVQYRSQIDHLELKVGASPVDSGK